MKFLQFRKTNHLRLQGSSCLSSARDSHPFTCFSANPGDYESFRFLISFLGVILVLLAAGVFLSVKSIALIEEKGDKDYAYSGLVLNLFFALLYLASLVYCFLKFNRP